MWAQSYTCRHMYQWRYMGLFGAYGKVGNGNWKRKLKWKQKWKCNLSAAVVLARFMCCLRSYAFLSPPHLQLLIACFASLALLPQPPRPLPPPSISVLANTRGGNGWEWGYIVPRHLRKTGPSISGGGGSTNDTAKIGTLTSFQNHGSEIILVVRLRLVSCPDPLTCEPDYIATFLATWALVNQLQ